MTSRSLPHFSLRYFAATTLGLALCGASGPAGGQGPAQPTFTVLSREGRRAMPLTGLGDQESVFIDDLASVFQLTVREEALGTITVSYKGRTILLTPDQALASISGRLIALPAPPARSGRRWLVPVEFISRALALIYDSRLDLHKPSHLLVVGDLRVPRVTARYETGDPARLTIDATPRANSTISRENNQLVIKFDADALDVAIPAIQPQGLVQSIRVIEPATLAIDLGPRFTTFRASSVPSDTMARLTIDFVPAQAEAQPALPVQLAPAVTPPDPSTFGPPTSAIRTIAIDPGHGGGDAGVKGVEGTTEKDLTLAVARRVKAAIESRLGIRVLLTRDDDRDVPLDGRAAVANHNKADLFISLHANASFRTATSGASILYAAFDRETERAAHASLGFQRLPTFGGGSRDVDLVLWDLAQIRHIDRSAELATILEELFHDRIPLAPHPVDRAPLSVLESANMPAVLVEMGYLTNADQEKQMAGADFQNTFVQSVYDSVLKFRDALGTGGIR